MAAYIHTDHSMGHHISYRYGPRGKRQIVQESLFSADFVQMIRSRWHVPTQILGTLLALAGYLLGHAHKGRQFADNVHAKFANVLGIMLATQIILGIYLRLHLEKGINGRIRCYIIPAHGILGKALPVVSWVQMLFGGIAAMGYCRGEHLGQCLAHFIMGSAFIAYGICLTILLLVGQVWLRRTGRSQEFFDSLVIAAWGCVNTFTEHRWGHPWGGNDLQHTSMGVVWWCAGILGMWLSRTRDGRPKRNIIPAIVIIMTGWAMSSHPQHLMLSTMIHTVFGYTLMAAGAVRVIEISFVLKDSPQICSKNKEETNSFQYLTPYVSSPIQSRPPLTNMPPLTAPPRLRLPLHVRHRRTNGIPIQRRRHPRLLHPPYILRRISNVSFRQRSPPRLRSSHDTPRTHNYFTIILDHSCRRRYQTPAHTDGSTASTDSRKGSGTC